VTPRQKKNAADTRKALREALQHAVDGQQRFGIREDARADLNARWDRVIDALEKLLG
jgi:hypothetical protein